MKQGMQYGTRSSRHWKTVVAGMVIAAVAAIMPATQARAEVQVTPGGAVTVSVPGYHVGASTALEICSGNDGVRWDGGPGTLGDDDKVTLNGPINLSGSVSGQLGIATDYSSLILDTGSHAISLSNTLTTTNSIGIGYGGTEAFSGQILGSGGITVSGGTYANIGIDIGKDLAGKIQYGNISATGGTTAVGFNVNNLLEGSEVTLGNITIMNADGYSYGVRAGNIAGSITTGTITSNTNFGTSGAESAFGFSGGNILSSGAVNVGGVNIASVNRTATGNDQTISTRSVTGATFGDVEGSLSVGAITAASGSVAGDAYTGLTLTTGDATGLNLGRVTGDLILGGAIQATAGNMTGSSSPTINRGTARAINATQLVNADIDRHITASGDADTWGIYVSGIDGNGQHVLNSTVNITADVAITGEAYDNATNTRQDIYLGGHADVLNFDATSYSHQIVVTGAETVNFLRGWTVIKGTNAADNVTNSAFNGTTKVNVAEGAIAYLETVNLFTGADFTNDGTVFYGANQTLRNLNGTNDTALIRGGVAYDLTLENTKDTFYAGNISLLNLGDITKTGTGELHIGGEVQSYQGNLAVEEGTLTVDGQVTLATGGSGRLTVKSGATIQADRYVIGGSTTKGDLELEANSTMILDGANYTTDDGGNNWTDDSGLGMSRVTGDFTMDATSQIVLYGTAQAGAVAMRIDNDNGAHDFRDVNGILAQNTNQFISWEAVQYSNGTITNGIDIRARLLQQANMSDLALSGLMMHNNSAVRGAAADRITQNFYRCCPMQDLMKKDNCGDICGQARGLGHSVWYNYVGRSMELDSAFHQGKQYKIISDGVQVGFDLIANRCNQLGVMFGYEDVSSKLSGDYIDLEDYYVGLYGAHKFRNGMDARSYFGYGWQKYELSRLERHQQLYRHNAAYDGNTIEATFELGWRGYVNRNLSFRPVIALDYFKNEIDAFSEDGDAGTRVAYDKAKLEQSFVRIGSDFQYDCRRLNFNGGLYYSYQFDSNGDTLSTRVYDTAGNTLRLNGNDLGNSVITGNLGGQYYLNAAKTVAVYGGYSVDVYADRGDTPVMHTGLMGMQWRF